MKVFKVIIIIATIAACGMAWAGESKNFRVMVDIGADEEIENQVTSYIMRELRALHDVIVVNKDEKEYDYRLFVIVVKNNGFVASVTVLNRFPSEIFFGDYENDDLPSKYSKNYVRANELFYLPHASMHTKWELKKLCEKVIAVFDSQHLEIHREVAREIKKKTRDLLPNIPDRKGVNLLPDLRGKNNKNK